MEDKPTVYLCRRCEIRDDIDWHQIYAFRSQDVPCDCCYAGLERSFEMILRRAQPTEHHRKG